MATPYPHRIKTPLPPEDLLLTSMTCHEELGHLWEMQVTMSSKKESIKATDLLGQPVTVSLKKADESDRHISGLVTRFAYVGTRGRYYRYQTTVRPWLWFLTRTQDCRIFQDKTVREIVEAVFADHSLANFEFKLFRSYRTWNYCVQYRESDFDFVNRLLEHEGIYYHFEHSDGQCKVVLVDSVDAHDKAPDLSELLYFQSDGTRPPSYEHVSRWESAQAIKSGAFALTDYDFERPATDLLVSQSKSRSHPQDSEEVFDYPGGYIQKDPDGGQYLETRLEEAQARFDVANGSTNATALRCGYLFTLKRHPRESQNATYLVTSTTLNLVVPDRESEAQGEYQLHCEFHALINTEQFRPLRRTPKAIVRGPQTAVVVGPAGEEIHTDKYGRVKLQFHWDRYGTNDEQSSCWVRVAQVWAGKNYGAIHIPRIGQEVIVDFLEGDPDQPIVTGRVYNAEQMPPWELPANKTQSGILTRSSLGGGYGNANAIRFEDKKGSEQLWIHAEKNQDIEVENDETHWVGHDRKKTVDNNETTKIGVDRTEDVGSNEKITIGSNRTENVGANEDITIGANRTENVGARESVTIGASRSHTVGASDTLTIAASQTVSVGASQTVTVGASRTDTVGGSVMHSVGGPFTQMIAGPMSTVCGGPVSVVAAGGFTLVAPGGTTIIDSFMSKLGGNLLENYSTIIKATPVSMEMTGFKAESCGIKIDTGALANKKVGAVLQKLGAKMMSTDSAVLDRAGLMVAKAGIHMIG